MFKKIYTPIDNSDISERVLHESLQLAKMTNAKLRIAHVVNLEQITFGIEMVGGTELEQTLLSIADKFLERIRKLVKQNELEAEIVLLKNYGTGLATLIIDDAQEWETNLFVLGSHHLGSFSHLITGGVAEDIARNSDTPILLITKHKKHVHNVS